jgi:serine/threonine-protein kinase
MIGKTLSHYRLVEKIGEGGMGVVYRAHDSRLERDVALKVLPTGTLADEAVRKRFRNEALTLSKLDHPNIETVHDFDTQEGVDFLVMQYISGETLDVRLASGPLSDKEVARLGTQIAEGLAAAHTQGIIHRDLKPGNLSVTPDGRIKLLDFGLAKLLPRVGEKSQIETVTSSDAVSGTLPYMAPEQLRGETVDVRTDIFALGAVLYEMATGKRPFPEDSSPRLIDAILHQIPVTPRAMKASVSPELERVVLKCLEKDPTLRYQSATDVGVDLRRLSATGEVVVPASTPPRSRRWLHVAIGVVVLAVAAFIAYRPLNPPGAPSSDPADGKVMLAVLPFDNLSADPEQEYFSDGMTEEMIAHLGRLQPDQLGVIARTSAMHYKGVDKRVDEIGRELGVDYILEGSVRRAAGRVRITAQLIQVSDQTQLWAENYERELANVFAVQNDVAERIADSLMLELLPAQQDRLAKAPRVNPEAREAYLKGLYYWNKRNEEGLKRGLTYFQQAIEMDPAYAPAYAGVADSYSVLADNRFLPPEEGYPKARAAALRALEIDDTLAEAHTSLASIFHSYDWDWSGAEKEYKRALALDPSYATGRHWYALLLANLGRHDEAIKEIEQARRLDPLSPRINANVGLVFYQARRYGQAISALRKALDLFPHDAATHEWLGRTYLQKGPYEEAVAEVSSATDVRALLACAHAMAGRRDEALEILDELKKRSRQRYTSPGDFSIVYAALGEREQAFLWLEKAFDERDMWMSTLKVDPLFDPLRSDPRFQDLLRRVGLPPDVPAEPPR